MAYHFIFGFYTGALSFFPDSVGFSESPYQRVERKNMYKKGKQA